MSVKSDPRLAERDGVARRLKELFYAKKQELLGGPYKPATRHSKFELFQKAAETCIDLQVPVDTFINAAFECCAGSFKTGPFPNMLAGNAIRGWVKRYLQVRHTLRKQVEETRFLRDNPPEESNETDTTQPPPEAEAARIVLTSTFESDSKFSDELKHALNFLSNCTGSSDVSNNEDARELLRHTFTPVSAFIRVALTYPDPEILERYGTEARREFAHNPLLLSAAQKAGYLLDPSLLWKTRNTSTT